MPDISDYDLLREIYRCLSTSGGLGEVLARNPNLTRARVDGLFKGFADYLKAKDEASSAEGGHSVRSSDASEGPGPSVKSSSAGTGPRSLVIHVDGASRGNPGPAAFGVVIYDGKRKAIEKVGRGIGKATNNVAEYKALIFGAKRAVELGASKVKFKSDSELLVKQINRRYKVRSRNLIPLHREALQTLASIPKWTLSHVPRKENKEADAQANLALDAAK